MTRVEHVLKRLGIEAVLKGREWVARCPNPNHDDRDPSWRIRDDPGGPKDGLHRCWPCQFEGGLNKLVCTVLGFEGRGAWRKARTWLEESDDYAPIPTSLGFKIKTKKGFQMPDGVIIEPLHEWPSKARRYVEGRGVTTDQIAKWHIGYALSGRLEKRIVIPYRDRFGNFTGYTARSYINDPKPYKEPDLKRERPDRTVIFGEEYWKPGLGVVGEGGFNLLAIERVFASSLAGISGSFISSIAALKITNFSEVIIATDNDEAGNLAADQLAFILDRQEVRNVRAQFPVDVDANAMDPNDLREVMQTCVDQLRW